MSRRTQTSWEVKERYNAKHYERMTLRVGIGGKEVIRQLAGYQSINSYIMALIVKDGRERGIPDISAKIGGGMSEYWTQRILAAAREGSLGKLPPEAFED